MNNSYTIYKEAMKKKGICCVTHKTFRKIILNTLAKPMRTCSSTRTRNPLNLERLRPEKHTLAKGNTRRDCVVVCSRWSGGGRHLTVFTATAVETSHRCVQQGVLLNTIHKENIDFHEYIHCTIMITQYFSLSVCCN